MKNLFYKNSTDCCASPSSSSASTFSVMEKVYETLQERFFPIVLTKIFGLIKKLPKLEQEQYTTIFYKKLIESPTILSFLDQLRIKVMCTELDKMTKQFEIFTKYGILPHIKVNFNYSSKEDKNDSVEEDKNDSVEEDKNDSSEDKFEPMDSAEFFKQFQNSDSRKSDNIDKIRKYFRNLKIENIVFYIDKTDEVRLLEEVGSRILSHERPDNRELYDYGPYQRRLDSLARLLSLDSEYSACVALTIYDSQLIISANQTDGDSSRNIKFFSNRIEKVREFLSQFYSGGVLIFKSDEEIDDDVISCFEEGGQLYDWSFPYLENLVTQNFKTSVQKLYELFKSEEYGGVGTRLEYFIKDAYKLAVTAYMIKHGIEHPQESILASVEKRSSPQPLVNQDTPASPSSSPLNCLTAIEATYQSSKYVFIPVKARASSPIYLSSASSVESEKMSPCGDLSQAATPTFAATRASSPVYTDESMRINLVKASPSPQSLACYSVTPTLSKQHGVENSELRQITSQEFMALLGIPNQLNVTYLSSSLAEEDEKTCDVFVQIHEDSQEMKMLPLNIKHVGKITDIHAEQLIMVGYFEHYKKIALNDPMSKVHIGLSKFACATCDEVKSQFPSVVFTGRSQVSFPNVANLKQQKQFLIKESSDEQSSSENTPITPKSGKLRGTLPPQSPTSRSSQECIWGKPIQEQAGLTAGPVSPMLSPASKKAKNHQNLLVAELLLSDDIDAMELSSNVSFASPEIGCKRKL